MAKFSYIDNAGQSKEVEARDANEAIALAPNRASNSGVMAVDTLSRKADPDVKRGVDTINDYNKRDTTPSLKQDNEATPKAPVEPITTRDGFRSEADKLATELAGDTAVSDDRARIREEQQVAEKLQVQNQEYNALTKLKEDKRKLIEKLQTESGSTKAQKDAKVAQLSREFDRRIADQSFTYNVALGDYQAAEKIANDYIEDLNADYERKQNTWSILMKMSEMTDEEKMIANQAFEEKQMQTQFELDKKKMQFENGLKTGGYEAPTVKTINGVDMQWNPKTGSWETISVDAMADEKATQKSLDQFKFLRETIKGAEELAGATGPNMLTQGLGNVFVGNTKVKQLAQKLDTLKVNLLTLNTDPAVKKFFGPQMTERDTQLMTSAGTTMDAYTNNEKDLKDELQRYDDLINRMQTALSTGMSGANIQTGPDGNLYQIVDDNPAQ